MYLCVRGIDYASSMIVSLDFQTIPTVWYFFVSYYLCNNSLFYILYIRDQLLPVGCYP
jgi:hypothetical protein